MGLMRSILLLVCCVGLYAQTSGVYMRWPILGRYTVGGANPLPAAGVAGRIAFVTDAATVSSCLVGGGSVTVLCQDTGLTWLPAGDGTSPGGSGITSLNGQVGTSQTFANDTNVTIGSAANTHTLGWSGLLAVARGGIGVGTITGILKGNGTSPVSAVTGSATDCVLVDGTSKACDGVYRSSAVIDVAAVPDGTCLLDSTAVTVTGAALGGRATIGYSVQPPEGVTFIAKVTGPNSMKVEVCNWSGASYNPASMTYYFGVTQ